MYDFYLDNKLLPVTPGKLVTSHDGKNKVYTLINDTEINIPKPVKLLTYSFQCMIPHQQYAFAQPSNASALAEMFPHLNGIFPFDNFADLFVSQKDWLVIFENLHQNKRPFVFRIERYIGRGNHKLNKNYLSNLKNVNIDTGTGEITLTSYNTSMHVTLENYKVTEDANDGMAGLDILVDLTLKQAVQFGTTEYTLQAETNSDGTPVLENGEQSYKAIPKVIRPTWDDEDVSSNSTEYQKIITRTDALASTLQSMVFG